MVKTDTYTIYINGSGIRDSRYSMVDWEYGLVLDKESNIV